MFLTAMPDQREALRPLLSAWMGTVISALMTLPPDPKRRIPLVMDELAALHSLEVLPTALAELRKYGGCVVAGLQDIHQLETLYGQATARTLLGLLSTKILFRLTDSETVRRLSESLGDQEISQMMEGISFGANSLRDGVSLSDQHKVQPIIPGRVLRNLQNLEAIIQFAQCPHIGQYAFPYRNPPRIQEAFIPEELHPLTQSKTTLIG